jgi:hypothetical protein
MPIFQSRLQKSAITLIFSKALYLEPCISKFSKKILILRLDRHTTWYTPNLLEGPQSLDTTCAIPS